MSGNKTIEVPELGSKNESADPKVRNALSDLIDYHNELLTSENKLDLSASGFKWYPPKIIATEQTRENTNFGFLATEDKIENVVLNSNGLIVISYSALFRSSIANAGRMGIFLGNNQILMDGIALEGATNSTFSTAIRTANSIGGLVKESVAGVYPTTGYGTGRIEVFAAAGTYTIGVKYKATSGSVSVSERKLWVRTEG